MTVRNRAYHAMRARVERSLAYSASHEAAADAHMRLSALRLSRAMVLEEVDRSFGKLPGDEAKEGAEVP